MEFTAEMIASFLGGQIIGDKNIKVTTVSKIEEASAGALAFLANPKYEPYIYLTGASIVIVNRDFTPKESINTTLIKVDDAYSCFAQLLELYAAHKTSGRQGISSMCSIDKSVTITEDLYVGDYTVIEKGVKLGREVKIYPQVFIGQNVTLGDNVVIYPGAKIYDDCVIGNNVTIHSGAVIGADGFGFAPLEDGTYKKIPQIGNVVIYDGVEIGANTCIDRATMGSTYIHKGVKLDNLIQIGHNAVIGANTVAAAQTGIAGSTQVGENCMFAGQVGIAGHLKVSSRTTIGSQGGVAGSVKKEGTTIMGTPAYDASEQRRAFIASKSLPDLLVKFRELTKEVNALKEMINSK